MDAANYLASSTQNIRSSVETFADEVEGELEKYSIFGVHLTRKVTLALCCGCVLLAVVIGASVGATQAKDGPYRTDTRFYSFGATIESSVGEVIFEEGTSEYQALQWLAYKDPMKLPVTSTMEEILERFILANLYFATNGPEWKPQYNFLSGKNVCQWNDGGVNDVGVYCDEKNKVVSVELSNAGLRGTLPRNIGLLTHVRTFRMSNNQLTGTIPETVAIMTDLMGLDLST
jgi:hypothetical protein